MGNIYQLGLYSLIFTASACLLTCLIAYCIKSIGYKGSPYQNITHKPFSKVLFDRGAYGEYLIYKNLSKITPPGHFLFNVYLPKGGEETTEIDALLIHPSGIYVFESKNYSGWIFGTESQRNWTQTLPGKNRKNHFLNPILQNELHLKWLKAMLANYPNLPFYSYVLFSDRCTLKSITLTSKKARVMNRHQVFESVNAQAGQAGTTMHSEEMEKVYQLLYPYSQTTDALKKKHVEDIQVRHAPQNTLPHSEESVPKHENRKEAGEDSEAPAPPPAKACPRCGKPLTLRTAQKGINTGQQFWGCQGFPRCRYIEPFSV